MGGPGKQLKYSSEQAVFSKSDPGVSQREGEGLVPRNIAGDTGKKSFLTSLFIQMLQEGQGRDSRTNPHKFLQDLTSPAFTLCISLPPSLPSPNHLDFCIVAPSIPISTHSPQTICMRWFARRGMCWFCTSPGIAASPRKISLKRNSSPLR